jgi:hypothetical protein
MDAAVRGAANSMDSTLRGAANTAANVAKDAAKDVAASTFPRATEFTLEYLAKVSCRFKPSTVQYIFIPWNIWPRYPVDSCRFKSSTEYFYTLEYLARVSCRFQLSTEYVFLCS